MNGLRLTVIVLIFIGATIAWAMDCYEHGYLTKEDTGGILHAKTIKKDKDAK